MTIDQNREQTKIENISTDQTMATTSTSTFTPATHFKAGRSSSSSITTSSQESELTSRLKGLDLKEKIQNTTQEKIPRRQPTIVCEDIADDIDFGEEELISEPDSSQESDKRTPSVTRSASTASLTVPQTPECDDEKRRPPLSGDDQMSIETN